MKKLLLASLVGLGLIGGAATIATPRTIATDVSAVRSLRARIPRTIRRSTAGPYSSDLTTS